MRKDVRWGVAAVFVFAAACGGGGLRLLPRATEPPPSFAIPFGGPGQLVTLWSWGSYRAGAGDWALVVTRGGKSQRLSVGGGIAPEQPSRVRWRSPRELLVEQYLRPPGEKPGTRISRLSGEGELLEVISDRAGLSAGEPSPDGRWLSLAGRREDAPDVIEIRDLHNGFAVLGELPEPKHAALRFSDHRAWSPYGSRLALAIDVMSPPHDRNGYVAQSVIRTYTLIVVRDCSCYEELPTHLPGKQSAGPGDIAPLFWTERGIYGFPSTGRRSLLRCDPEGGGCSPVYDAGSQRVILQGRRVGDSDALLLAIRLDPWQPPHYELHRVDLAAGQGRVLYRFPEGYTIADVDWSPDPWQERPDHSTPRPATPTPDRGE